MYENNLNINDEISDEETKRDELSVKAETPITENEAAGIAATEENGAATGSAGRCDNTAETVSVSACEEVPADRPDATADSVEEKPKKSFAQAYGQFTLIFGSLLAFVAATWLTQIGAIIIIKSFAPQLLEVEGFNTVLSIVTMYLAGFPIAVIVLLLANKGPVWDKKRISFGKWLKLFCISSAMLYAGSIIANVVNAFLNFIPGANAYNVADDIIDGPLWLSTLASVVLAPIVEELLFRKLLIDRMRCYGEKTAIFISALCFGLFHGNFSQLFYAFAVGLLFGYIYSKTRRLWYTISLHAAVNFFFGTVSELVYGSREKLSEALTGITEGSVQIDEIVSNISSYIGPAVITLAHSIVTFALVISGLIFFIIEMRKKLTFEPPCFVLERGKLSTAAVWEKVSDFLRP